MKRQDLWIEVIVFLLSLHTLFCGSGLKLLLLYSIWYWTPSSHVCTGNARQNWNQWGIGLRNESGGRRGRQSWVDCSVRVLLQEARRFLLQPLWVTKGLICQGFQDKKHTRLFLYSPQALKLRKLECSGSSKK